MAATVITSRFDADTSHIRLSIPSRHNLTFRFPDLLPPIL